MFKHRLILTLSIYSLLIFLSCSKYNEEAPFFDGLFLEYRIQGTPIIYEFNSIGNGEFKIIKTEKWRNLGDDVEEIYVDKYGRVYETRQIKKWGKEVKEPKKSKNPIRLLISAFFGRGEESENKEKVFSTIWIPAYNMKVGDTLDDIFYVVERGKWRKWEVLKVKDSIFGSDWFFDLYTGFRVGYSARTPISVVSIALVNTNADISTIEE